MNTKEKIIETLLRTERYGIYSIVDFLENGSDFFTAPASTKHHLAIEGGLAEHSWNVCDTMRTLNDAFGAMIPDIQIVTVSLLHDVCKTGYYAKKQKWRKDDHDKWESYDAWETEDMLPLGHGEKSLYIVGRFLRLDDAEAAAIRWHMGAWTSGVGSDYATTQALNAAVEKYPLVTLLITADFLSTKLVE